MAIIQMSDALANKIAAGEVVERPASVVKELVENSIDANSTWIKIELEEAGLASIRITDDGDGMEEADVERAFLRHATSKISSEADLFHVRTLGFRGEALASIAAVSKVKVKTSNGKSAGTELHLEGGRKVDEKKSDARKGTTIEVNELFYNTPARLKYMKSLHTELGHVTDLMNRLAFAHPEVRFEVTHNEKGLFRTAGTGDILQVISQVYGMNVAKKMLPIEKETLDFKVSGYIARPEITRASRNYISLIINGRYLRSIPLSKAILKGYHTLLPIGRYPVCVIQIEMDPILLDVNVHPTKLEARFSKDQELFQVIEETVKETFRKQTLIPELGQEKKPAPKTPSFQQHLSFDEKVEEDTRQQSPVMEKEAALESYGEADHVRENNSDIVSSREETAQSLQQEEEPPEEKVEGSGTKDRIPPLYPIGQLQGTYILAQNENGLYMVDQHAAQERIKYEFFKEKLGKPVREAQELLIPMTFEFSRQEAIFIDAYKEKLEAVGLFFEPFGNQAYVIRSYPNWFPEGFEEEVIREMVDQVMNESDINVEAIREDAAILMSCKRSIKANHYLKETEMTRLLNDLRETTDPFTCPHGRPIIVHFSTYELEKMFKRVM